MMKRTIILCLLGVLSTFSWGLMAADAPPPASAVQQYGNQNSVASDANSTAIADGVASETAEEESQQPVAAASTPDANSDETLNFFVSLNACTPGIYKEKNILAELVGPVYLQQTITNADNDVCTVNLSTPDNRTLTCQFDMYDLRVLSDQHFIAGILVDTYDKPTQESINSDDIWSDLKFYNCNFN